MVQKIVSAIALGIVASIASCPALPLPLTNGINGPTNILRRNTLMHPGIDHVADRRNIQLSWGNNNEFVSRAEGTPKPFTGLDRVLASNDSFSTPRDHKSDESHGEPGFGTLGSGSENKPVRHSTIRGRDDGPDLGVENNPGTLGYPEEKDKSSSQSLKERRGGSKSMSRLKKAFGRFGSSKTQTEGQRDSGHGEVDEDYLGPSNFMNDWDKDKPVGSSSSNKKNTDGKMRSGHGTAVDKDYLGPEHFKNEWDD